MQVHFTIKLFTFIDRKQCKKPIFKGSFVTELIKIHS